jgi:hypothetical protein
MDPFAAYALDTQPKRTPPPRLTGGIKTRAAARLAYQEIVSELGACEDADTLDAYLLTVGEQLIQFQDEIEHLWNGDGADFAGLDREIKAARLRVAGEFRDDRLGSLGGYEPSNQEEGTRT